MAGGFQLVHHALDSANAAGTLARDGGDRWPRTPLVARAIGKRQKDELLTVRELQVPDQGHDADAHSAITVTATPGTVP